MKKISLIVLCAFFLLFFFSKCTSTKNGKTSLSISNTNFGDVISRTQSLVFTFNEDIVSEGQLFKTDTTKYLNFDPNIIGQYRWVEKNKLQFNPLSQFNPSTKVKISLNKSFFDTIKNHKFYLDDIEDMSFRTPLLRLKETQMFWDVKDEQTGDIELKLNLIFNHNVMPAKLNDFINIKVEKEDVAFNIPSTQLTYIVPISLPAIGKDDEQKTIEITVKKGFLCEGANLPLKEDITNGLFLPSIKKLSIVNVNTSYVNNDPIITVSTNQGVVSTDLSKRVSFDPKVSFTVHPTNNGFSIKGDFKQSQTYNMIIHSSLQGRFGKPLGKDYHHQAQFGEIPPSLRFLSSKGQYLSPLGERNIGLEITNLEDIKVEIYKIYENNLVHYLHNNYNRRSYDYYGYNNTYFNYDLGDRIYTENIKVNKLHKDGAQHLLNIDLEKIKFDDKYKGLYMLKVSSEEKNWLNQSRLLSMSDIGLITKQGKKDLYIFANSINSTKALEGVKISLLSNNNQSITSIITDKTGTARIKDYKEALKHFKFVMLSARKGADFNVMSLNNTRMEMSQFDVGGKRFASNTYDAFLYGERNLYRPGDTVNYNLVLRSPDLKKIKEAPVKFEIRLPNGKVYKTFKKETNAEGAASVSAQIPADLITGYYSIRAYTGDNVYLTASSFNVEEFMPDRIKVETKLNQADYSSTEKVSLNLKATNLYGTPATNRNYEVALNINKSNFTATNYRRYNFNINDRSKTRLERLLNKGQTDDKGSASLDYDISKYENMGLLYGSVQTTVFDETGRPVNRHVRFPIYTQPVFYGIKRLSYWVNSNQPMNIQFIGVDKIGSPVNCNAKVKIIRYYYESVIVYKHGRYRYQSQKRESVIYDKTMNLGQNGNEVSFTPYQSGQYEVRIHSEGTENYVASNFYAYGWGRTSNEAFAINNEGEVEISFDKSKYNTGDVAKVLLTTPFEGKILASVERDDVEEFFYLETKNKAASFEVELTEKHLPNTYITAIAFRKMDGVMMPLTVARGAKPIFSNKEENKIQLEILATGSSRSKTKQNIKIKSSVANAEITLAVVDEGILQIKNYQTPDPFSFFYAKRALNVKSNDIYGLLYPELKKSSTAGGSDNRMAKRTNPLTNKRVRLVSFWSDHIKTDNRGEANYEIDIPEYSGSLRIMGVAYKDKAFGSAEKNMIVADPIVISTALPRFSSPMDTFLVPVNLANTLNKTTTAKVSISSVGALEIVGSINEEIELNPKSDNYAYFLIAAKPEIGYSTVTVSVKAHNETFTSTTNMTVRPPSSLVKQSGSKTIKAGKSSKINLSSDFIALESKIIISTSPMVQFAKDLDYLVGYPHGCLEQTTSKSFPQLYFSDLTKSLKMKRKVNKSYNTEYFVQEGIKKIESMQVYNGGFSYWRGGSYHWWGSSYATHFLLEAKKAGYEVNDHVLNKVLDNLSQRVKQRINTYEYDYRANDGMWYKKLIYPREALYSLYVLAISGRYEISTMNFFKENRDKLSLDSKYLLACTYALAGKNEDYKTLLPSKFFGEESKKDSYRSFSSPVRDKALALNALIEINPEHEQVASLAQELSKDLKTRRYLSTQERAFAFLALGKLSKMTKNNNVKARILADGEEVAVFDGKDLVINKGIENKMVNIKTEGTGYLYVYHYTEGISVSGNIKEVDNLMQVRRQYYNRDGNIINQKNIQQNDLIVVQVSARTTNGSSIKNVAITDLLPAGLEIENPRLSTNLNLSWKPRNSRHDAMDVRDDRITYFTTLNNNWKRYHYVVRAVSKGKYKLGPVSGDAMYDGEYHSYNGAGEVVIK